MLLIYLHSCFHKNTLKYKSKTKNPKHNTKIRKKITLQRLIPFTLIPNNKLEDYTQLNKINHIQQ